jgi:glucose/arabinose dehydrogenase
MLNPRLKRYSKYLFWSLAALAAILGLLYAFFGAPKLADGLHYRVFAENLEEVSALAFDENGDLYATLEKRHGQGQLVHIRQGLTSILLDNMNKPDGILRRGNTLYITNEVGRHAILVYESGTVRYLEGASGAEGIASAGPDKILVIEDKKQDGRLLRIDPATAEIEVLLSGLQEAEGVCQDPGGDIYYVEKTSDHLSRYRSGRVTIALTGLVNPAFLNCLDDGTILITEDRTNFGRLLRYRQGAIEVLATHLRSPQSVIIGDDGAFYLAEQRKGRILRIYGY